MAPFEHRIRKDRSRWIWELCTAEGEVLDSGFTDTEHQAKAALCLAEFAEQLKQKLNSE